MNQNVDYKEILTLSERFDVSDIVLVYYHNNNNLIILSIYQLIIFLTNNTTIDNNIVDNYTFISLCDLSIYGKNIIENTKSYLLSKFLNILQNICSNEIYRDDDKKLLNELYLYLTNNIKDSSEEKSLIIKHSADYYLTKYMKYKNKYLNLIKNNIY